MSRNIPRVRLWRVRYHMPDETRRDVYVRTINKRFARWEARERGGWANIVAGADDETVSLVRVTGVELAHAQAAAARTF